ncbi:MAG: hypothetical protein JSW39_00870 [Desulfobacterales bacterium]|nr:MAG: hypothetical protein JSW39_00870 [Desulfobacterales bacterium]
MLAKSDIGRKKIAVHDNERKGIFIHKDQLAGTSFRVGDKFSIKRGKQQLFTLTIIKDEKGEIIYDKNGIFVERSRLVDILLGGIFDEYQLEIERERPGTIEIKPLEVIIASLQS